MWIVLIQVARAVADVWASARQLGSNLRERAKGIPRSLLPPFDDENEPPIPPTWRTVEERALGRDVGLERQRQRDLRRPLQRIEDVEVTVDLDESARPVVANTVPAPPPRPLPLPLPPAPRPPPPPRPLPLPPAVSPAVSAVPTLRPLPSGMPTRKSRRPGH
jgi:hypothetical protein